MTMIGEWQRRTVAAEIHYVSTKRSID